MKKLPGRTATSRKTTGYWLDDDGQEHGPLVSGKDEDSERAARELQKLKLGPGRGTLFTAEHVEVKFAVRLRHSVAERVTLIINNAPCQQGRYSCDRLLPQILRSGQQITLYWPSGQKTYHGRRP